MGAVPQRAPIVTIRASEFRKFASLPPEKQAEFVQALKLTKPAAKMGLKPSRGNFWASLESWIVKVHQKVLTIDVQLTR